jgi:prepilin-type N-terminal cleavage/methylation domain-containing protein
LNAHADFSGVEEKLKLKNIALVANRKGFTLIELMAVLVIMGIMFSVAIKKFDTLSGTASLTAIKTGVRELNIRETLVWTQIKLSDTGWTSDADVYNTVDKNLGQEYRWNPGPTIGGGTLHYRSQSIVLVRNESKRNSVGSWK